MGFSMATGLGRRLFILTLVSMSFVFAGAQFVAAQDLVQPDGRINQVAHFGGDSLYCVDSDFVATNQYSDFGGGGFRLLNSTGQELMFIPASQISAAVAEAKTTGKGILVGSGRGTYGPVTIYTYVTGDGDDFFVFSAYDEFGKLNTLQFKFCIPVGPSPETPGEGPDPDDPVELCTVAVAGKIYVGKVITIPSLPVSQEIPCDQCDVILGGAKLRWYRPANGVPTQLVYCYPSGSL